MAPGGPHLLTLKLGLHEGRLAPSAAFFYSHACPYYAQAKIEGFIMASNVLPAPVALEMMKLLSAADHVPKSFKASLAKCIHNKVTTTNTKWTIGKKPQQQLQSCKQVHQFLPKWVWDVLLEPTSSYSQCLLSIKSFCRMLGLTNGNEPTWVCLDATMLLARSGAKDLSVPLQDAFTLLQDLKTHVRPSKQEIRMPHWGGIIMYPPTPQELKYEYPDLYETAYPQATEKPQNGPQACPLDLTVLEQLISSLPARNSHHTMALIKGSRSRKGLTGLNVIGGQQPCLEDSASMPDFRVSRQASRQPGCYFNSICF